MKKINVYLFYLTNKYLIVNFLIFSIFIIFINLLELSRVISENEKSIFNFIYLSFLKYQSIINEIIPFVTILGLAFLIYLSSKMTFDGWFQLYPYLETNL